MYLPWCHDFFHPITDIFCRSPSPVVGELQVTLNFMHCVQEILFPSLRRAIEQCLSIYKKYIENLDLLTDSATLIARCWTSSQQGRGRWCSLDLSVMWELENQSRKWRCDAIDLRRPSLDFRKEDIYREMGHKPASRHLISVWVTLFNQRSRRKRQWRTLPRPRGTQHHG